MKTKWGSLSNNKIGGSVIENSNTKQGSCLGVHILKEMNSIILFIQLHFHQEKKMWSVQLTGYFKSNLIGLNSIS